MAKNKVLTKLILPPIIILLLGYIYYSGSINSPVDEENTENISFQIRRGESPREIAKNLEEADLIKSDLTFYMYLRNNELGPDVKAGRFLLKQSMNVPEILEVITNTEQGEAILTIQEGLRIRDVEQKLIDQGLLTKGQLSAAVKTFDSWSDYDFLSQNTKQTLDLPLEGFIYPDTYFLNSQGFEPGELISKSLNNFERKWNSINKEGSKLGEYSIHEIVTMASIIENEVFGEEDRALVSGLLWKRLENGWTLGADATLLYITEDRTITATDLQLESPYNTRKFQGLPPGPISNPSISSIRAALFPKESEYWFYLTTLDTGEVIYARTNEEHNQNRARYLF